MLKSNCFKILSLFFLNIMIFTIEPCGIIGAIKKVNVILVP